MATGVRLLVLLCLSAAILPATVGAQVMTTDPDAVRLELGDIRRLADVLQSFDITARGDAIDSVEAELAATIERDYLAHASAGFRVYADNFGVTGTSIAASLSADPGAYADLDGLADAILAHEDSLRAGFRKLQQLIPEAVFPTIWFFAGDKGAGGLTRAEGVLVAAERYAERPADLVPLVLHELAHFQQAISQGVETYQRIFGPDKTLLALSLREGSADLIAELTTGRHINPEAERYGLAHEAELWSVFKADMSGSDTGDWMFVQPSNPEWPPDLGYWIGYRIAKSYYEHADDKAQAIRDILGLTEFTAFLEASQYDGRTTSTLPDAAAAKAPALLLGSFVDDYGIEYEVSEREWVQYPDARYHIARWEPDGRYLLARNDSTNPSDGGLWTRIDWVQLTGMAPFEWAFCLSAYAAPSAAAAESTRVARPETPRTGCNGHPYSRMRRQE